MRLLYGVQGTGNGHLTRARIMAQALASAGIKVQYLFSGRPRESFFDMQIFGNWWWYPGLTFATCNGRICYLKTLGKAPEALPFLQAVGELDLTPFDLVLTDFEPISAWAAIIRSKPVIGLGHQYAFRHAIPTCRGGLIARMLLRWYAPASISLGLHWHPFGQPILPPLVETLPAGHVDRRMILVYLPFESLETICRLLNRFPGYEFKVYSGAVKLPQSLGHIHLNPLSRQGFQQSLASCSGVLCNAGFELISEALQAGKKILVKPLAGQWEQCCNAKALVQLGWGEAMSTLDVDRVAAWLEKSQAVQVTYPDVAGAIAHWLKAGDWTIRPDWIESIWHQARLTNIMEEKGESSECWFKQRALW